MFRTLLSALCLCLLFKVSHGQTSQYYCPECSIDEAKKISNNFGQIPEMKLYCLLHNFSVARCENSSEYMEFANPLLFDILTNNSAALLSILNRYPELYTSALHKQFQNPLLDFNINRISFIVDSANPRSRIKQKVLDDLDAINVDDKGYPK